MSNPSSHPRYARLIRWLVLALAAGLAGCAKTVVLHPAGDVAAQQGHLVVQATVLMLIIIVPVIALTLLFAWKYRQSNTATDYDPEWHHSTVLELVIWTVPLFIVIALGAMTWIGTHKLDPYRPLDRISATRALTPDVRPLEVEVVALNWKWLFFYPEQGIAIVNELAAPVDRPIHFKLTASATMNAFYVPDLAGMIYAMPGMQTELHAVINREGNFPGMAAHYSGAGFSDMNFRFLGLSDAGFADWVQQAKAGGRALDRAAYLALAQPGSREPVRRFASVEAGLYDKVLNRCVEDGKMCMHHMMTLGEPGEKGMLTAMSDVAGMKTHGPSLPLDVCTIDNASDHDPH